jgi:hypothetical protein
MKDMTHNWLVMYTDDAKRKKPHIEIVPKSRGEEVLQLNEALLTFSSMQVKEMSNMLLSSRLPSCYLSIQILHS